MRHPLSLLGAAVLAGLTLSTPFSTTALAQAPGGQGGAGRYATGAVTAVDATAGTITVTVRRTGASQTLKVAAGTPIATQATVAVSDLKVGDQIQVSGVPTNISAAQIVAGDAPTGFPPLGGGPGGPGGLGAGNPGAGGPGGAAPAPAYATATGKITATSPLTISLSSGITLTMTPTADAKVSRITTQTMAGIKVGDRVSALGQTETDGTFTASAVAVNWTLGGFGGGRGRRGGGQNGGGQGQAGANAVPGGSAQ